MKAESQKIHESVTNCQRCKVLLNQNLKTKAQRDHLHGHETSDNMETNYLATLCSMCNIQRINHYKTLKVGTSILPR